ncbi:MAG: peptidylprolyl isomerase, partial [Actinomycetota bacterium]
MAKRSRHRHLAKLAARRQAERDQRKRRRSRITGTTAVVIGVALLGTLGLFVFRDNANDKANASATPSASASASPKVACGATVPKEAGAKKPTFAKPPKMTIDPSKAYTATMVTSCGTIEMRLDPQAAPEGVNNFVFLADRGFYDGLTFHRIVKDFVIQGGDPQGNGKGGPGYGFPIETDKHVTFDKAGVVAYANGGPDTNGSQFFITLAKTPQLDPTPQQSFTIFGHVIKGMDVVQTIGKIPGTSNPGIPGENSVPTMTVYIEKVTIHVS